MPNKYTASKKHAKVLVNDVLSIVRKRHPVNNNTSYIIRMGRDYYRNELLSLKSYETLESGLLELENVKQKYDAISEMGLISRLVEAVVSQTSGNTLDIQRFNFWWNRFCSLLDSNEMTVRIVIGLSNFVADKYRYRLSPDVRIFYFDKRAFWGSAFEFFTTWEQEDLRSELIEERGRDAKGMVVIDLQVPADSRNIEYRHFMMTALEKEYQVIGALKLAGSGRLAIGPIVTISNPNFPCNFVSITSGEQILGTFENETNYKFTSATGRRFRDTYRLLEMLESETKAKSEDHRTGRARLRRAISRYYDLYEFHFRDYYPSTMMDLVILLESLYSLEGRGTKYTIALAASNLLSLGLGDAKEIFENILVAYDMRNTYAHGDSLDEGEWGKRVRNIIDNAHGPFKGDMSIDLWTAIEILRDYVRRTLMAFLNLHYAGSTRRYSKQLLKTLITLHLDPQEKKIIQQLAQSYSLMDRFI